MNKRLILISILSILFVLSAQSVLGIVNFTSLGVLANNTIIQNNTLVSGTILLNYSVLNITGCCNNSWLINYTFFNRLGTIVTSVFLNNSGYNGTIKSPYALNITFATSALPDNGSPYNMTVNITNGSNQAESFYTNNQTGPGGANHSAGAVVNISVDNTAPTITVNAPANGTIQLIAAVTFNYSVFDTSAFNTTLRNFAISLYNCTLVSNFTNEFGNTITINRTNQSGILNSEGNSTDAATNYSNYFNSTTGFNYSLKDGMNMTWAVACTDRANNTAISVNRSISIDTSVPGPVQISFDDDTPGYGLPVTITCDAPDAADKTTVTRDIRVKPSSLDSELNMTPLDRINSTEYQFISTDTANLGVYTVNCTARDRAGRLNSTTKTFEVVPQEKNVLPPNVVTPVAKQILSSGITKDSGTISDKGTSWLMSKDSAVIFSVKEEKHTFTIKSVGKDSVTIEIKSEPFEVTINKGESKNIDIDKDGLNDVLIILNGIFKGRADLTFKPSAGAASEESTSGRPSTPVTPPYFAKGSSKWLVWLLVIIVIIIVVALIIMKVKGRDKISFKPKDLGSGKDTFYETPHLNQQPPTQYPPKLPPGSSRDLW